MLLGQTPFAAHTRHDVSAVKLSDACRYNGVPDSTRVNIDSDSKIRNTVRFQESFPQSADDYELTEEIGPGIFNGTCINFGQLVTIVIEPLPYDQNLQKIHNFQILKGLNHRNILKIQTIFLNQNNVWSVSQRNKFQNLQTILQSRFKQGIKSRVVLAIGKILLSAIKYLHQNSITHNKIFLDNIFLDEKSGTIVLGHGFINCPQQNTYDLDIYQIGSTLMSLFTGKIYKYDYNMQMQRVFADIDSVISDVDFRKLLYAFFGQEPAGGYSAERLLNLGVFQCLKNCEGIILNDLFETGGDKANSVSDSSQMGFLDLSKVNRGGSQSSKCSLDSTNLRRSKSQPGPLAQPQACLRPTQSFQPKSSMKKQRSFQLGRFTVIDDDQEEEQIGRFKLVKEQDNEVQEALVDSVQAPATPRCLTPRSPRYVVPCAELVSMAMQQLVEIQEAQRTLADQFNVLLAAITDAQKGRMDNLQLLTSTSFIKLVPRQKLEEYESMKDKIIQLEQKNMALSQENSRMKSHKFTPFI